MNQLGYKKRTHQFQTVILRTDRPILGQAIKAFYEFVLSEKGVAFQFKSYIFRKNGESRSLCRKMVTKID